jgi:hypothetical protein
MSGLSIDSKMLTVPAGDVGLASENGAASLLIDPADDQRGIQRICAVQVILGATQ